MYPNHVESRKQIERLRRRNEVGQAHHRSFGILNLLRLSPKPLTLSAIAEEMQIATSSTHAIIADLVAIGVVTVDRDRRYSLGPKLFHLGSAYVSSSPIYRAAWGDVIQLAVELGVSCSVATLWEGHHLVIAVNHGPDARRVWLAPGARIPLTAGSYGKAYFAWSDAEVPNETLRAFGPNAITDPKAYAAEVEVTKERGYATDDEEFAPGIGAVAAAVTSINGYEGLVALWAQAIDLRDRVGFDTAGRRLTEVASRVSSSLGDGSRERMWYQDWEGALADLPPVVKIPKAL
jgi:DNA-binding IclR family transcriptional regulator